MSRGSKPQKVEEWTARLGRFGNSGQTVTQFCKSERVSQPSFYQWKKKLNGAFKHTSGKTNGATDLKLPAFRAVEIAPVSHRQTARIRFFGGVEIELGNDLQLAQAVVATVAKHVLDRQTIPAASRSC